MDPGDELRDRAAPLRESSTRPRRPQPLVYEDQQAGLTSTMSNMTKDDVWLRGRAQLLCSEMQRLGVRIELDNAKEFIQHGRRLIAANEGISEIGARKLFTGALLRRAAVGLAESATASARAELAGIGSRRLSVRGAHGALMGVLEAALLDDGDDEGAWPSPRRVELALALARIIAPHTCDDDDVVLSGRMLRDLHETLREGASSAEGGDSGMGTEEASDVHAFLTRMANALLAASPHST